MRAKLIPELFLNIKTKHMKTVTIDHKNGHSTTYKISENGTAFHEKTDEKICAILDRYINNRNRLKLYYGDVETGRDWYEEMDTAGRIGRSTGTVKIPLLIATKRSTGGGSILDHCIVKIKDTETGIVLYQNVNYQKPSFEIVESDMKDKGYLFNVHIDGQIYSRHKTELSAKRLIAKLS